MSDELIHLREDHDNIGESTAWCGTINPRCVEHPKEVTCRECLATVVEWAAECAQRLKDL